MADTDRERRFGGIGRLYGAPVLAGLQQRHVVVVGIGGVGSWAAEALARSGVGRLTLIDLDQIALSNVNRQIHALQTTLGATKVTTMAERLRSIDPACEVRSIDAFIEADTADALLPDDADALIDAIDAPRAKAALHAACARRGLWAIASGGAGGRSDPTRVRVSDLADVTGDPLLARLRQRLRREYGYPAAGRPCGLVCVHSDEVLRRPAAGPLAGLHCAGYGSSVCVTAVFGCIAAAQTLDQLSRQILTSIKAADTP